MKIQYNIPLGSSSFAVGVHPIRVNEWMLAKGMGTESTYKGNKCNEKFPVVVHQIHCHMKFSY